jgi:hypothetical protein
MTNIGELDAELRIWIKKGRRYEVKMSVTQKSDMDLKIERRLEAGRRSESYRCVPLVVITIRGPFFIYDLPHDL